MTNKEIVEQYIEKQKTLFKKFLLRQFIIDVVEIVILVFAILKTMDNTNLLYTVVAIVVVVMMFTVFLNIQTIYGGLRNFTNGSNILGKYNTAKEELTKAKKLNVKGKINETELLVAQKKFEEEINIIANEMI
jgi:hypothetical protein